MIVTTFFVVILTLSMPAIAAEKQAAPGTTATGQTAEPQEFPPPLMQTGKERLGRKWSDEQRVDNCNVPLGLRGPKPRPNDCASNVSARSKD